MMISRLACACTVLFVITACGESNERAAPPKTRTTSPTTGAPAMSFPILSSAFGDSAAIPAKYTCEGGDTSPPLAWKGAPATTKSYALIVDDPDAPDPAAPKMTYVHWVLYNIPASASSLLGNSQSHNLPKGTLEGKNDWNRTGYGGPCPPIGSHRYFFKLYALDTVFPDLNQPS